MFSSLMNMSSARFFIISVLVASVVFGFAGLTFSGPSQDPLVDIDPPPPSTRTDPPGPPSTDPPKPIHQDHFDDIVHHFGDIDTNETLTRYDRSLTCNFKLSVKVRRTNVTVIVRSLCGGSCTVPCGRGGDYYVAEMASALHTVTVGPFVDEGNGRFTATVNVPAAGVYTLCVELAHTQVASFLKGGTTFAYRDDVTSVRSHERSNFRGNKMFDGKRRWCIAGNRVKTRNPKCLGIVVVAGEAKTNPAQCGHDGMLYGRGAWTKNRFQDNACVLHDDLLSSVKKAQECVQNKWLVFWGDSTLQQTAMNIVEDRLRVPIMPDGTFMEQLTLEQIYKRNLVFYYREFDRRILAPTLTARVTFVWGGCRDPQFCCPLCRGDSGMNTLDKLERLLIQNKNNGPPHVLFMSHFGSWETLTYNEPMYIARAKKVLERIRELTQNKTKIVWMYPTAESNETTCLIPNMDFTFHSIRRQEVEIFQNHFPMVTRIDRYAMSYPFRYGTKYAHSGNHYGNTIGVCQSYLGRNQRKYLLAQCLRDTSVDEAFQRALLHFTC